MQVFKATAYLGSVEDGPLLVKARVAHVVDVKLQIAAVHYGQHQAQRILGLIGVCKTNLEQGGTFCHVARKGLQSPSDCCAKWHENMGGGQDKGKVP